MAAQRIGGYVQTNILRVDYAAEEHEKRVLRKIAHDTIDDIFSEDDPSVKEWFQDLVPTASGVAGYFHDLFPSASWLRRYNLHWLLGDAIAGMKYRKFSWVIVINDKLFRRHRGFGSGSSSHGLCFARSVKPGLRPVYHLHRSLPVLDIRDFQRHCHRCECAFRKGMFLGHLTNTFSRQLL